MTIGVFAIVLPNPIAIQPSFSFPKLWRAYSTEDPLTVAVTHMEIEHFESPVTTVPEAVEVPEAEVEAPVEVAETAVEEPEGFGPRSDSEPGGSP
jgi:hypothetical protein